MLEEKSRKQSPARLFHQTSGPFLARIILPGFVLLALLFSPIYAQFGKNKVQYKNFDWKVLKSEHFDVYFYEKERSMVLDAARLAERAFTRYTNMLNFKIRRRIPLILYASHNDFSQTNVLPGEIDEGLAGVNEFIKRRVLLPFTGSWKDFEHVLSHELAHAFQIDIIWGDVTPVANPFAYTPPLWFIEGMVEQLSLEGMTTNTEMMLRDAALSGYLMSLEELSYMPGLASYRFGHSFWYFIAQRYGNKKIGEILQKTPLFGNIQKAFKSSLGANLKTLSRQWTEDIRKTYLPQIVRHEKPEDFSRRLTDHEKDRSPYNVTPALNSTGEQIAYISLKSGYTDIWLANAIDGSHSKKLVEGQRNPDFESFRFLYTSLDWSPDDRYLTFVAKSGMEEAVYVFALYNKKVWKKFKFGFDGVLTPNFSPDGKKIVFNGINGGTSNLYEVDLETGELTQLTNDRYTHRDPVYSPDGKKIAFTTEYGPGTDLDRLIFSDYRIAILDLETGEYSILPDSYGDNYSPQWSPSGDKLAYVSDRTGIPNIFYYDFNEKRTYQVTNILTGITGPTDTSPCLSWSRGSGRLAFSAFFNGGWDIFVMNNPERYAKVWVPDTTITFDYQTVHLNATIARIERLKKQLKEQAQASAGTLAAVTPEKPGILQEAEPLAAAQAKMQEDTRRQEALPAEPRQEKPRKIQPQQSEPQQAKIPADLIDRQTSIEDSLSTRGSERRDTPLIVDTRIDVQTTPPPADTVLTTEPDSTRELAFSGKELPAEAPSPPEQTQPPQDSTSAGKEDTIPSISFDFDVPKEKIPLPDTASFTFSKYKAKFSTDYVTGYGGYQGNIGATGGVMVSFSDQLGNHNIMIGANIYGKIQDSDLWFQYMNLQHRTDIGFFLSQFRELYYLSALPTRDQYLANIWRGAGLLFSRPFNRFRRIEWGISAYAVSEKTFELSFLSYYYYNDLRERNVQKLGTTYFAGPHFALVYDNSAFGMTGPVDGSRYRLSARHFFGELSYSELIADWRKYWLFWRKVTIAMRGIGGTRWGNDPRLFYVGGPYTFRGAWYGDLQGTNILLGNLELRFPLIAHLVLDWPLPIYLRGIGGVLFLDVAGAWFNNDTFQPFTTTRSKFFRFKNAQGAYGFGLRMNLGYLVLRYDVAKSFDHYENRYYRYGYQVFKANVLVPGRKRSFISIGADF